MSLNRAFTRALAVCAAVVCLFFLSGCDKGQSLSELSSGDTIVAFGDSLTEGYGVSEADSYPQVLAKITGMRVVNEGISGELSGEGLVRLPSVLAKHKPALVILMHGGNDILQNRPMSKAKKNLAVMIEMIQRAKAQVILIGVPEKSLFSDSAPIYSELAEQYNLVFEDSLIADLIRTPSKKSDSIHFNASGYEDIAQTVKAAMDKAGAI
jgi:lysophospholipase L1-like esterase